MAQRTVWYIQPISWCHKSIIAVLKRVLKWKEVDADTLLLSLFFLQNYYNHEIMRGFCDMGNYTLKSAYDFARLKDDEVDFPDTVHDPDDIVKLVKSEIVITHPPND